MIPPLWKPILKQKKVGEDSPLNLDLIPKGMKLSKYFYWKTVSKRFEVEEDLCKIMWETELQKEIASAHWNELQMAIYKTVKFTRLRFL